MINKLQDLEKDILFFYDYLLFLKEDKKEDGWLAYVGVYHCAGRILAYHGIEYGKKPKRFKSKNMVTNYINLTKSFCLEEFRDSIFDLGEVKLIRNQWRLLF